VLWTIAWRNIWRNKRRSGVILCAIALGLWAGLVMCGLMYGMGAGMTQDALASRIAEVEIHREGFLAYPDIGLVIPGGDQVLDEVRATPLVAHASGRSVISAMATSPTTAVGVVVYGIDARDEESISDIHSRIVAGTYFAGSGRNAVVIGQQLAERLSVGVGDKIVLTSQDAGGAIAAGAFRVVGMFETVSSAFDRGTVFAERGDVDRVYELAGGIHEIAIVATNVNYVPELLAQLKARFPALDVKSWKALAPELAMMTDTTVQFLYIFLVIVLLALAFGMTNTMLMGVMERVRELGVLMALGMGHGRIFLMIMLETILMALGGGVVGMGLSAGTIAVLARTGIDLSIVSTGLGALAASPILRPTLPATAYWLMALFIMVTAIIAALFPGLRASRLDPVKAIRTY
jgi:putative ABC transport system permease protein